MNITERFLSYVGVDTTSNPASSTYPSTERQKNLGKKLVEELKALGMTEVEMDEFGYVYATVPATTDKKMPAMGFIAHMDTVIDCLGNSIHPQIVENYDGGDIVLNKEKDIVMRRADYEILGDFKGETLITTDGTTLLGADDKAGIAEIVTMGEYFLKHPEIPHGKIRMAFTPDEEIGRGADKFNVEKFGCAVAYTVDGGRLGELEYNNFNGAALRIEINGLNTHPGAAKLKMINSLLIAMEYQSMLPEFQKPMYTEEYEGFFHLNEMAGNVEHTTMHFIIRDHSRVEFEKKKKLAAEAGDFLNKKYGEGVVEVHIKDSYYNMLEVIEKHPYLLEMAQEALEELGVTPIHHPCRGGTDGSRLCYMGLPCPNLCAGGINIHSRFEFVSVQSMEKITELLISIVKKYEKSF